MKNRLIVGLAVALMVAATVPAAASTFVAMDQQELLASSAAVVDGRVLDVRSFWNDDHTNIISEARIEVTDLVAGDSPAVVTVRTFGGEVGNYRVEAHGFPTFASGDRVLLFLAEDGDAYRVSGYAQGHFRVRQGAKGELAVPTIGEGVRFFHKDGSLGEPARTRELGVLKNQVREQRHLLRTNNRDIR